MVKQPGRLRRSSPGDTVSEAASRTMHRRVFVRTRSPNGPFAWWGQIKATYEDHMVQASDSLRRVAIVRLESSSGCREVRSVPDQLSSQQC